MLINDLFISVFGDFEGILNEHNIETRVKIPDNTNIYGNPILIRAALSNPVKNSIEALIEKKESCPEYKPCLSVYVQEEEKSYKIMIEDNGVGLKQKNVFEPFISSKTDGTGLGLPFTKMIIEQYNGSIEIERKKNPTLLTIMIPKETKQI